MSSVASSELLEVRAADRIDWSKPFMPDHLTPLFHTPGWTELEPAQQVRYNQIHALYFHEQIIFFERSLAPNLLNAILREKLTSGFRSELQQFMQEEARHSAMFWNLNRKCAPLSYKSPFHFIRVNPAAAKLIGNLACRPRWFPLFVWLMLLQEERALYYGTAFGDSPELEPHFRLVHQIHLADEAGHVRCDLALLDFLWPQTSPWLRRVNMRLLAWMIQEFFSAPKRAGLRVLEAWMREFPALAPLRNRLREHLLSLDQSRTYRRSLYSAAIVPRTASLLDRSPECAVMRRLVAGDS